MGSHDKRLHCVLDWGCNWSHSFVGDLGMSGFKGTPGPWIIDGWRTYGSNGKVVNVAGNGIGLSGSSTEETMANGRLCLTSPELLEVCQRARSHLYQAGYEPKENSLNPNEDLLFQLNAAIKKALGE